VLENTLEKSVILERGTAVCQLLLLPARIPELSDTWSEPDSMRGNFGSTGQNFKTKYNAYKKFAKPANIIQLLSMDLTKNQVNLMEMASKSNISATAYMLTLGIQSKIKSKKLINCYAVETPYGNLEKKIYMTLYINNLRVIACVDSGSDITIMQEGLYNAIFKHRKLPPSQIKTVKTFSSTHLKILGEMSCLVKFTKEGALSTLTIYFVEHIGDTVPMFLFGNDSLKATLATLAYSGHVDYPIPEIKIRNPEPSMAEVFYETPEEIHTAFAVVNLKGYGIESCEFFLHEAAPVVRTQEIILTSDDLKGLHILPSKSSLEFCSRKNCYKATGCVVNLTNKLLEGWVGAKFETIQDMRRIPITKENKFKLKKLIKKFPLKRRIYYSEDDNITLPLLPLIYI